MATADSVRAKMQGLIDSANAKTGSGDTTLTAAVNALIAGFGSGGGAKITEYVVTEDADRSLWLNSLGIKLVKGVNLILLDGFSYGKSIVNNRQGLTTFMCLFWDGVAAPDAIGEIGGGNNHFRGFYMVSNGYTYASNSNKLVAGNTSKLSVAVDGTLTLTTSATGVTTGNYNNSFIGAGNTYYLLQIENEVIC